jgi:two-component system, cell cycle sensor histidine kinase and response regulator CckA
MIATSVLLVDDDPSLRRSVKKGLQGEGFSVLTAGTAEEALRIAADPTVRFDVVVMDIVLPDSWGSQVAMEQSLFRPGIPVIFVSGQTRDDVVLEASSGHDEIPFLAKPFSVEELAQAIRKAVGKE